MADNLTSQQRKIAMSRVRGQNTTPERLVRSLLHRFGFRFRKNVKSLPGTPDIVLPKYRAAIFVNGCFWHGHESCKRASIPNTRREFWEKKISSNISRDKRALELLQQAGWQVITIWQCQLKNQKLAEETVQKTAALLAPGRFSKFCVGGDNQSISPKRRPDYAVGSSRTSRRTTEGLPKARRSIKR